VSAYALSWKVVVEVMVVPVTAAGVLPPTIPSMFPVTFPVTSPVTLPVTLPVILPVNTPAIAPVPVMVGEVSDLLVSVCVATVLTSSASPSAGSVRVFVTPALCGCA